MVPLGFTAPFIGVFALLLAIGIGGGFAAWAIGRYTTYKNKEWRDDW
jgi:hypothetical protein